MQQTTEFFQKLEKERRILFYLTFIIASIKWNSHQDCSKLMKENGEMRLCRWCFLTIVHCKSLKGGACKRRKMRVFSVYRCHTAPTGFFKSGIFKYILVRNGKYVIMKATISESGQFHDREQIWFIFSEMHSIRYHLIEFAKKWAKMIRYNKKENQPLRRVKKIIWHERS